MRIPSLPDKPLLDLTLLALLVALLFAFGLGARPYAAPSEARYVEIGREMAQSQDYVTPRLNYVKYFEKPPLFYWVEALTTRYWGVDFFKARVPTAAFALLLCLLTYGLGRMLYGRLAGWLGSLVLATSLYLFALSRVVLLDVPVSVFLTATLGAFLYAANAPQGRKRTLVLYGMYIAAAGATLTKGLIGMFLPGAVIGLWLLFTNRWKLLAQMRLVSGILLFLLLTVPWHVLVSQRNPEFLQFYFIHEHFERYLTHEAGRYQPDWFFIPVLLLGLFPWIPFVWQSLKSGLSGFWTKRHENANTLFIALWIGFIFCFFSLSDSKLIPYILPIFPPIAALMGRYFAAAWEEKPVSGFGLGVIAMLLLLLASSATLPLLPQFMDPQNKVLVALAQAGDEVQWFSIACFAFALILLIVFIQGRRRHVVMALVVIAAAVLQLGDAIAAHYDKDSMQALAGTINAIEKPGDEVATYGTYYQDLPIYLKLRITVADWKGELEFGSAHEDTSAWMIDDKEFWKRWMNPKHVMFTLMRYDAYTKLTEHTKAEDLHLYMLQQAGRNILFCNEPYKTLLKRNTLK